MRAVSLLPSATEICYALGVEPVAVSHECDVPPEAAGRPTVNGSRVTNTGSSAAINDQVEDAAERGGVYEIDRDAIREADPDLVIAQSGCDVCAIDASRARVAVDEAGVDATVLTLHPHSLSDLLGEIELVGEALGRPGAAESLVSSLRERIAAVEAAAIDVPSRPRVAVLDWMDPVMVAGHWVPEMAMIAGGRYGLASTGDRSSPREWDQILRYDPEVLIAAPCGFDLERTVEHFRELTHRPGWTDLAAVTADGVHAMDGHHFVNRPGPRLVDTVEYLAGILHPDRFDPPPETAVRRMPGKRAV